MGQRIHRDERLAVIYRDGRYCRYCGRSVQRRKTRGRTRRDDLTIDHVIPVAKGGSSRRENLVVSCAECNGAKADLDLKKRVIESILLTNSTPIADDD